MFLYIYALTDVYRYKEDSTERYERVPGYEIGACYSFTFILLFVY